METVAAPFRRWGSHTGVLGVGGLGGASRTGLLHLAPTQSERDASGLEGLRARSTRGRQTPVTITPAGAPGRSKALDARWPRS
jgi:hypothetical protein